MTILYSKYGKGLWKNREDENLIAFLAEVEAQNKAQGGCQYLKAAFEIFVKECGPLFREYLPDLDRISIRVTNTGRQDRAQTAAEALLCRDIRDQEYGWSVIIEVRIQLQESTRFIPFQYRPWGQTLTYEIGGGRKPGILSRKSIEQLLCGWPDARGENYLRQIPALEFIPGLD